jgi:hypothetical protein
MLLKFVHWGGMGLSIYEASVPRNELLDVQPPPLVPDFLDPRAVDAFHSAMWLQTKCETISGVSMSHESFYKSYSEYCAINLLNPVPMAEFLKLAAKFYKENAVSTEPPIIIGVKPIGDKRFDRDADSQLVFQCGFERCEEQFNDHSLYLEHIKGHTTRGVTCPWKHCKLNCKTKIRLRLHLQTHISGPTIEQQKEIKPELKLACKPNDELRGIPLCALLVIRNIARHPQNQRFFGPVEKQLTAMLLYPKYSKTVASIFAELKQ